MADTDDRTTPPAVPLMPTGNGVTDLETAREQDAVAAAQGVVRPEQPPMDDAAGGPDVEGDELTDDRPTLSE